MIVFELDLKGTIAILGVKSIQMEVNLLGIVFLEPRGIIKIKSFWTTVIHATVEIDNFALWCQNWNKGQKVLSLEAIFIQFIRFSIWGRYYDKSASENYVSTAKEYTVKFGQRTECYPNKTLEVNLISLFGWKFRENFYSALTLNLTVVLPKKCLK